MDHDFLVNEKIEDGQDLIARLIHEGLSIDLALWIKTLDGGYWHLYMSSHAINPANHNDYYKKMHDTLKDMNRATLDYIEVMFLGIDKPIAREAIALRDRQSARIPIVLRETVLGKVEVEFAYIYPALSSMSRKEVLQTVARLMDRSTPVVPPLITLRDGSSFHALPLSMQVVNTGEIQLSLHQTDTGRDINVVADSVVSIY